MSLSKNEIQENFKMSNQKRKQLGSIPKAIQEYLQFMEHKIRKQFKSFSIGNLCGGNRGHFLVDSHFERAFLSLSLEEKSLFYSKYIQNVDKALNKTKSNSTNIPYETTMNQEKANISFPLKVGKSNNSFSESQIQISDFKVRSKGKTTFDIDLRSYLLRKSKKKDPVYILEAIKASSPETIRFSFLSIQDESEYFPIVKQAVEDACYQNIERQIQNIEKRRTSTSSIQNSKHLKLKMGKTTSIDEDSRNLLNLSTSNLRNSTRNEKLNRSIVEDVIKARDDQELDEQLTQIIEEQNQEMQRNSFGNKRQSLDTPGFTKNIFRIILPNYSLKNMSSLHHYGSIYESSQCKMYAYQNVKKYSEFKMQVTIALPIKTVCKAIINVQLYKYWHPQVRQGQIKLKISQQNSCILYQKAKALSQWYKQRDYLLLAHMFEMNGVYYIVSKSIENSNFVPFQSITRGNYYYMVWKVQQEGHSDTKSRVIMEMKIDHNGLLNRANHKQLSLRYLRGFENLQNYFKNSENQKKLKQVLTFDWSVQDREVLQSEAEERQNHSIVTNDFDAGSQISEDLNNDNQTFYSIEDLSQSSIKSANIRKQIDKSDHQIQPSRIEKAKSMIIIRGDEEQDIKLDREGLVILPQEYLKKKQIVKPFPCEKNPMKLPYENIICKDDWAIEKTGGMKLVNQVKIDAQNNVIKFIMKTLKKNLFSGKGLLNISLPVQIFNVDSNLQRLCQGMSLGPQLLQSAVKINDKLERFKKVLAFGLSNTVIYVDVQKPFNPILGQTYQGHIRGCPIFAEQISHHPPITSIYFAGRGYRVTGNFEGKVKVHMNSGEGSNDGYYYVRFDDGGEVVFSTPAGEISGLAVGDRKFNVKGSGCYFDQKNGYFCEMVMECRSGMFGKKRELSDQIDGQILRVKPDFIQKLKAIQDFSKIPTPSKQDILQRLGVVTGRWPLFLKIDGVTYYDVVRDIPDKMVHEIYPLPSNSNYRQDLLYRKKGDLSRSQIQKERLEVLQRGDKKLRGNKGH